MAEKMFGIGPFTLLTVEEAGVRAAMADWAGVEIELIEATNNETREQHKAVLGRSSAKLTHIGAYVEDKDAGVEHLRSLGAPIIYEDIGDENVRTAMADLRNEAGFLLELLQRVS